MRIDPATITFEEIEKVDGKNTLVAHTESVYLRSIKFRKRAKIVSARIGDAVADAAGNFKIPFDRNAEYQVAVITETVCDEKGKPTLTPDMVDDWSNEKRIAYMNVCEAFQNPTVEEAAKNSSATEASGS